VETVERREVRKTVTILFSDVIGSTALGEQLDPEALRTVMGRYFSSMKAVIERHGGTVEKFIGDAIMAVFGVPTLHEDDALRAVRAAAEMRDALTALNRELEAERGIRIAVRTGVNTGEVVAGHQTAGRTLVTGDTVNTAARLEQGAAAGEILLGEVTARLVRDAVRVEPVLPLDAKGKALPVAAMRLLSVTQGAEAHNRRLDAPLVGRERELAALRNAFERVTSEHSSQLFTLLGAAGVGKSRLVGEFSASLSDATVLRGRCLPYGEGITYWPVAEVVRQAAGISEADSGDEARAKLRGLFEGQRDADPLSARVAAAVGLSTESAAQEEIFWAVRKLLEQLAQERPLVIVWDDIHWAEPTFLDLIEHVADLSRNASLLLLCPARPELLDTRPGWGGGKLNSTTILLEPLPPEAAATLMVALPGGLALDALTRRRIAEAAEGNPLFVEEMLGMLIDDGYLRETEEGWQAARDLASVRVPPSIQALLAARLDRLAPGERAVAERAAVVGRVFERSAVAELASDALRPTVTAHLVALVRKELLRPDDPGLGGDDAFRFRHILIRDAAYEALPKSERAELHERFADWLASVVADRLAEYEEVIAHHLEQAYSYREQLGESGDRVGALRTRAGEVLDQAGRRAFTRGDSRAAIRLLRRATGIFAIDSLARARCQVQLADALLRKGALSDAIETAQEAARIASALGDESLAWHARVVSADADFFGASSPATAILRGREALENFARLDDPRGEARAHKLLCAAFGHMGKTVESLAEANLGVEAARRAGDVELQGRFQYDAALSMVWGLSTPDEILSWADGALASVQDQPRTHALVSLYVSLPHAMLEHFDVARVVLRSAVEVLKDLDPDDVGSAQFGASIELLAGDLAAAERMLREEDKKLAAMGELNFRATVTALLAEALARQDSFSEATQFAAKSRELADPSDYSAQVPWRGALALCLAAEGRIGEAEALAREAVSIAEHTEDLNMRGDALLRLAEVLATGRRPPEALETAGRAIEEYERKGNLAALKRAQSLRERFEKEVAATMGARHRA
jgi:class 3 adenylate cyclase/tetratricopeptide (TPR) repeat protein